MPGPDEILLDMKLAPVNPADLLIIEGAYGVVQDLPMRLGAEGVGIVCAAGAASGFMPWDVALPLVRGCWAQRICLKAASAVRLSPGINLPRAAMLRINPATARRMLDLTTFQAGDFVVQNGGGGSVGRAVARLATRAGLRVLSVARRPDAIVPEPGEIVVADGADVPARVKAAAGGAPVRLALDCVAGEMSGRLAACLVPGGTLVVFGHLSGRPCEIPSGLLTSRGLTVRGFSLRPAEAGVAPASMQAFYDRLAADMGNDEPPIVRIYPLAEIHAALAHAAQEGRGGKVLLDLS